MYSTLEWSCDLRWSRDWQFNPIFDWWRCRDNIEMLSIDFLQTILFVVSTNIFLHRRLFGLHLPPPHPTINSNLAPYSIPTFVLQRNFHWPSVGEVLNRHFFGTVHLLRSNSKSKSVNYKLCIPKDLCSWSSFHNIWQHMGCKRSYSVTHENQGCGQIFGILTRHDLRPPIQTLWNAFLSIFQRV